MSFDAEYEVELLQDRVSALEEAVNTILVAMQNVVSVEALHELVLTKQKDVSTLETRITALQNQLNNLSEEIHVG